MTETQRMVCEILEEKPIARTDDFILYGFVLKKYGVSLDMSIREFFQKYKNFDAPTFKTIERARRAVQSVRLDLLDPDTAIARRKLEEQMRDKKGNV